MKISGKIILSTLYLLVFSLFFGYAALPEPPAADLRITYVGNAGYLLEADGRKILIDALLGSYQSQYVQLPREIQIRLENAESPFDNVDLVLATHVHHDHFGARSVGRYLLSELKAQFVSTGQAARRLAADLSDYSEVRSRIRAAEPQEGVTQEVANFGLQALNLHHGRYRKPPVENLGFVMRLGGWNVLHVGDTEITSEDLRIYSGSLGSIDVAMIPTWFLMGKGWESVQQWRSVIEAAVNPRYIVLIHLPLEWTTADSQSSSRKWIEEIRTKYPDTLVFGEALESKVLTAYASQGTGMDRPVIRFVREGTTSTLDAEVQGEVVRQVETIYGTCALNSRRSGTVMPREDLGDLWDQLLQDSYVHLEYPEPTIFLPDIAITEILQAFPEGNFLGHLLTKGDGEIIAYGKCDGLETLRLMCLEGLSKYLPSGYQSNCHIVDRVDRGTVENLSSP